MEEGVFKKKEQLIEHSTRGEIDLWIKFELIKQD